MLSPSQERGYASAESRLPALIVHSSVLTCTNPVTSGPRAAATRRLAADSWKASIFDNCPMCDKAPLEPVRIDGQLACRTCTSACTVCGSACVPGDDACSECVRHLGLDWEAIPA